MNNKVNLSRRQYLELYFWNTVIYILSTWQEKSQIAIHKKASRLKFPSIKLEYILIAAAGLGFGLLLGAIGV